MHSTPAMSRAPRTPTAAPMRPPATKKTAWHVFAPTDHEVPTRDMKASGVAAMRYVVNDGLKTPGGEEQAEVGGHDDGHAEGTGGCQRQEDRPQGACHTGQQQNATLPESAGEQRGQA
ncbi:hypothetical protein GCM10017779_61670 [Streptomyces capillispiralis]|uniref:Uncharacterized protein n=1 Tax=Streptomyces capillispiralis TaxID=68182 RepID=A0A561TRZ4_9ACTN|nr:hypothetical protein FHX78_116933 [Streptomyces capillispiralis]GHH95710.1 hypothetical protein GCM10017779_61670 [Streptomyces capillispiralis]